MSWKSAGLLVSGAPSSSTFPSTPSATASTSTSARPSARSGQSLAERYHPQPHHGSAYARERQSAVYYHDVPKLERKSEWDVLREHHRFIRPEEGGVADSPNGEAGGSTTGGSLTWEERLARRYEEKLFKEYALIDLKHYKSRRYALRWRTAPEVVNGIGEETCASLRCKAHRPLSDVSDGRAEFDFPASPDHHESDGRKRSRAPELRSFELPFAYVEGGERKEAMVKVRLCRRCERKLRWRPEKEGAAREADTQGTVSDEEELERVYAKGKQVDDEATPKERYRDRSRSRSPGRDGRRRLHERHHNDQSRHGRKRRVEDQREGRRHEDNGID